MSRQVAVVIGVGGMGQSIARRIGPGTHLLLADFSPETLDTVTDDLRGDGYEVTSQVVDVSSRDPVVAFAERAASMGEVRYVVHTAGLSPVQAPVTAILAVGLLGVALATEEFGQVVASGGAGVVIAGMAAHSCPPFSPEQALQLATTPADQLLGLPIAGPRHLPARRRRLRLRQAGQPRAGPGRERDLGCEGNPDQRDQSWSDCHAHGPGGAGQ